MSEDSIRKQDEPVRHDSFTVDEIANLVFSNVKLYLDAELKKFDKLFIDVLDLQANVATLSTLLHGAGAFTREQFESCFVEMRDSFGRINFDGSIDGSIEMIKYNFNSENEEIGK